jgi:hypothetical protein
VGHDIWRQAPEERRMSDVTISCPLYEPNFCNELRFRPMRTRQKIGRAHGQRRGVSLERHETFMNVAEPLIAEACPDAAGVRR